MAIGLAFPSPLHDLVPQVVGLAQDSASAGPTTAAETAHLLLSLAQWHSALQLACSLIAIPGLRLLARRSGPGVRASADVLMGAAVAWPVLAAVQLGFRLRGGEMPMSDIVTRFSVLVTWAAMHQLWATWPTVTRPFTLQWLGPFTFGTFVMAIFAPSLGIIQRVALQTAGDASLLFAVAVIHHYWREILDGVGSRS